MASFSERHGYKEVRTLIQREGLDDETRMELWNLVAILPIEFNKLSYDTTEQEILRSLWVDHFHWARDEISSDHIVWRLVKKAILEADWWEVFDLLEVLVKSFDSFKTYDTSAMNDVLPDAFNTRFENNLVGYRFIGRVITPLDSAIEVDAVAGAIEDSSGIKGARHALDRAIALLSDRQNPDYLNSIKESISAVESVVKKVTGEGTLGAGLTKLESAGLTIHPALKAAWSKMYGWTSDAGGIRHADIEAAHADQALAKYMLVTSSAFVSYLIEAARKNDLL